MCTCRSLEFLDDKPSLGFSFLPMTWWAFPSIYKVHLVVPVHSTRAPYHPSTLLVTQDLFVRPKVPLPLHIPLVLIGTPFTYIHDLKFYSVCLFEIFKTMAIKYKNCKLSILFCILQIVKSVPYPFRVSHLVKSAVRNTFPPTPCPQFPWVFATRLRHNDCYARLE